ncbi:MAG: hypothetical protein UD299_04685 [Ruminococcus sp.]|nr:hypothetical protein [Ruminococcus sp.]
MWAARPHLASIFEKLLDQKTFYLVQRFKRNDYNLLPRFIVNLCPHPAKKNQRRCLICV